MKQSKCAKFGDLLIEKSYYHCGFDSCEFWRFLWNSCDFDLSLDETVRSQGQRIMEMSGFDGQSQLAVHPT